MALGVRREGYYAWRKRPKPTQRDAKLVSALKEIRKEHPCYGVRSMIGTLPEEERVSYGKGYRVCGSGQTTVLKEIEMREVKIASAIRMSQAIIPLSCAELIESVKENAQHGSKRFDLAEEAAAAAT